MSALVFIDKDRFEFYGSNVSGVKIFEFKPELVRDLEVLNWEEFSKEIVTFITTLKIKPTNLMVVLSENIVFQKEIPLETPKDQQDLQIQNFLNNVPFAHLISKIYTEEKSLTIAAFNKELYSAIQESFEKQKFTIESLIPATMIGASIMNLTESISKDILHRSSTLKSQTFPLYEDIPQYHETEPEAPLIQPGKPSKKKIVIYSSIMIILLVILGVLLYNKMSTPEPTNNVVIPTRPSPTIAIPTLEPTISVSTTPNVATSAATISPGIKESDLRVQILNGSGIAGQADQVKNRLSRIGFTSAQTGNAGNLNVPRTSLVCLPSVPTLLREKMIVELKLMFTDVSTRESSDLQFDCIITTGKTL